MSDAPARSRRRGRAKTQASPTTRDVNYRQLRNPFPIMNVFSDDEAANMHVTALELLETLDTLIQQHLFMKQTQNYRSYYEY